MKFEFGWFYCAVILICILVNFIIMIVFAAKDMKKWCRERKKSKAKAKKHVEEPENYKEVM